MPPDLRTYPVRQARPDVAVKVPPYEFDVHADHQRFVNYEHGQKESLWGYMDLPGLVIGIDGDQVEVRQMHVLVHELLHAICTAAGIRQPKRIKNERDWEELLDILASGLLNTLQLNPAWVRWLATLDEETPVECSSVVDVPAEGSSSTDELLPPADPPLPVEQLTVPWDWRLALVARGVDWGELTSHMRALETPTGEVYIPQSPAQSQGLSSAGQPTSSQEDTHV